MYKDFNEVVEAISDFINYEFELSVDEDLNVQIENLAQTICDRLEDPTTVSLEQFNENEFEDSLDNYEEIF